MTRPPKKLSGEDQELIFRLRREGKGLRQIAMEVSIFRGAYAANLTNIERRRRTVSYEHLRQFLKCQETKVSKNQAAFRKRVSRQETKAALDERLTQPQTDSSKVFH